MIPTDFLFHLADYEGIQIEWANLSKIKGIYISTTSIKAPVIALSHNLHNNERELRCVLAHELGHHFETAGHHMLVSDQLNSIYASKNEKAATEWAVNFMIDTYTFVRCLREGFSQKELEDYFYVSSEFVMLKGYLLKESDKHSNLVCELKTSYNACFRAKITE